MFNKDLFINILSKINSTYSSITEFAQKAKLDRSYISKYVNRKLDNPPSPKILEKIAHASNGITTYEELMEICGYIIDCGEVHVHQSLFKADDEFLTVPIFINNNGNLEMTKEDIVLPFKWDHIHQYFGYRATDDSMLPLLR